MSLTIALLAFSCSSFAEKTINKNQFVPTDKSNEYYLSQAESIKVYNEILEGFSSASCYTYSTTTSQSQYPDYYGGAYIDENTGELVVLVTAMTSFATSEISTLSNNSSQLRYELCDVSYNEMCEAIDFITDNFDNLKNLGVDIDSVADDIMTGTVNVSVIDLNDAKKQILKEFVQYDFLNIVNSEGIQNDESNLGGGYGITSTNNGGTSTLGFAATRNGVSGFVIAEHSGDIINEQFKWNGTIIGSVTATAYYNRSTADAAFITANSNNVTPTNTIFGGGAIWSASPTYVLPVNSTVYMLGVKSSQQSGTNSKIQSGKIISTNATIDDGTYKLRKQWKADYSSQEGDSGGPVMCYDGNYGGQSKYTLYGIHHGSSTNYTFFSPYINIVDELNVTCITG